MMFLFLYRFPFTLLFLLRCRCRFRFRFRFRFLFPFLFLFRIPVSDFSRRPLETKRKHLLWRLISYDFCEICCLICPVQKKLTKQHLTSTLNSQKMRSQLLEWQQTRLMTLKVYQSLTFLQKRLPGWSAKTNF